MGDLVNERLDDGLEKIRVAIYRDRREQLLRGRKGYGMDKGLGVLIVVWDACPCAVSSQTRCCCLG
jgi:hypothetical protein